jgi:hypothetical protein
MFFLSPAGAVPAIAEYAFENARATQFTTGSISTAIPGCAASGFFNRITKPTCAEQALSEAFSG